MASVSYIRGPVEFHYGDDFDIFWERFEAFVVAAKCEEKAKFSLFLSYLDNVSFRRVKAIDFLDEHKDDANTYIVMENVKALIETALTAEPDVPDGIALKYILQKKDETHAQFGDSVRLLGRKVHGDKADCNPQVIESFCTGLQDTELASKMVHKTFGTLSEAVKYAESRKGAKHVKILLGGMRSASSGGPSRNLAVLPAVLERTDPSPPRPEPVRLQPIRRCYNCDEPGHLAARCTKNRTSERTRSIVCRYCKREGHVMASCWQLKNQNEGYQRGNNRYHGGSPDSNRYSNSQQRGRGNNGHNLSSPANRDQDFHQRPGHSQSRPAWRK